MSADVHIPTPAPRRAAMATGLFALTVAMGAGVWIPTIQAAFDSGKSMAQTVSAAIASIGVDAALEQYHVLRGAAQTERAGRSSCK